MLHYSTTIVRIFNPRLVMDDILTLTLGLVLLLKPERRSSTETRNVVVSRVSTSQSQYTSYISDQPLATSQSLSNTSKSPHPDYLLKCAKRNLALLKHKLPDLSLNHFPSDPLKNVTCTLSRFRMRVTRISGAIRCIRLVRRRGRIGRKRFNLRSS